MTENSYYLGVYGNTQKTLFALYDREVQRIDLLTAQSIDHEFLPRGFHDFEEILCNSLNTLLSRRRMLERQCSATKRITASSSLYS